MLYLKKVCVLKKRTKKVFNLKQEMTKSYNKQIQINCQPQDSLINFCLINIQISFLAKQFIKKCRGSELSIFMKGLTLFDLGDIFIPSTRFFPISQEKQVI